MKTQTAILNEAHWNDIIELIDRGKSDISEYLPYAEKDGCTQDDVKNLERLLKNEASSLLSNRRHPKAACELFQLSLLARFVISIVMPIKPLSQATATP